MNNKNNFLKTIILFFVLTIVNVSIIKSQIPEIEFNALKALYDSTDGENWDKNTNWDINATKDSVTNDWYGITIINGHVTNIYINDNNLQGSIPVEIGNFSELKELNFGQNSLSGTIPTSIGNLSKLKKLYLNDNGGILGEIPAEIGNLSELTHLYLSSNKLTGDIPAEIYKLKYLNFLWLYNNLLTGTIPSNLDSFNNNLLVFSLSNNNMTGTIPDAICNLGSLNFLSLSENNFTGSLPDSIGNLKSLTSLSFTGNKLTGEIPASFYNLSNLGFLRLDGNKFSGSISPDIKKLTKLYGLFLNSNDFTGSIPKELGDLVNLKDLFMQYNEFSGSIPKEIGNLSVLTELRLDNNNLTDSIPSEIGNLSELDDLRFNNNKLTGKIPANFKNLTKLSTCYLNSNLLSSIEDISGIGKIPSVNNNNLTFADIDTSFFTSYTRYYYQNQILLNETEKNTNIGDSITLNIKNLNPDITHANNQYQWFINNDVEVTTKSSDPTLTFSYFELENQGEYYCVITNTIAPKLTLTSEVYVINTTCSSSPTTQATNLLISEIEDNSVKLTWTSGNDNVLVLVKEDSKVIYDPLSGVSYTPNTVFGSSDEIAGSFVVYSGTNESVVITGLKQLTDYHFAIYKFNSNDNCYNKDELLGDTTTTGYCEVYGFSEFDAKIDEVIFNTINENSADTNCVTYTDNSSISTDVAQGKTYNLSVTAGTCETGLDIYKKAVKVFVDWNGDKDFEDAEELIFTSAISDTTTTYTPDITIPTIQLGKVRMRVICTYAVDSAYLNSITACDYLDNGEVEDYSLNIIKDQNVSDCIINSIKTKTSIYPNPITDNFKIVFDKNTKNVNVSILDINGRILQNQKNYVNGQKELQINTSTISSGIYFVNIIIDDRECITKRIIVNKYK